MRSILTAILIISVMIVLIVGIENGVMHNSKAQSDQAFASAMESLSEAMRTVKYTLKLKNF